MKLFNSGKFLHPLKNLWIRLRYGSGCCDVFNLDYHLAKIILPHLKEFRKNPFSYPAHFNSHEEWEEILDKMIWAFDDFVNGDDFPADYEEQYRKQQEGFELFGKHFRSLWQ